MGFAFAEENKDTVHEIAVAAEPNGECIAPTAETISDNSYPLSRDLYIYVNTAKAAENASVAAFVDYYLADGTISSVLETVPYVNLAPEALAETPGRLGRRQVASPPPPNGLGPWGVPGPFAYPRSTARRRSPFHGPGLPGATRPASRSPAAPGGDAARRAVRAVFLGSALATVVISAFIVLDGAVPGDRLPGPDRPQPADRHRLVPAARHLRHRRP